jgi:undecaprenyl-diphosphatase
LDYLIALVLGIVQGLTEFLPVSSSGHLEIIKGIFSTNFDPKESLVMTVVLHFATALSTIFIFRKDIIQIISGVFFKKSSEERSFSLKIIVSMMPAGLVGVFFNDIIESLFDGQLVLVGFMLIITGILLFFCR